MKFPLLLGADYGKVGSPPLQGEGWSEQTTKHRERLHEARKVSPCKSALPVCSVCRLRVDSSLALGMTERRCAEHLCSVILVLQRLSGLSLS
jgi:hypothetical protein